MNSLREDEKKWQELARRIRRGKTIEDSAREADMPLDDALKWVEEQEKQKKFENETLRQMALSMLADGYATLLPLLALDKGRLKSISQGEGIGESYDYPDIEAAKILMATGLALIKIVRDASGVSSPLPSHPGAPGGLPEVYKSRWGFLKP